MSLPWLAEQIIHASRELKGSDKSLLLVLAQLDRGPEGAFIGQARLAERTGMGPDNVKERRQGLVEAGLLRSERRPGKRTASWFVTWPGTIPLPTGGRFDEAKLLQLRDDLDGYIRIHRADARAAAVGRETPGYSNAPVPTHLDLDQDDADGGEPGGPATPVDGGADPAGSSRTGDSTTPVSANGGTGAPLDRGTAVPLGGGVDHPAEYGSEFGRGDSSEEILASGEILNPPNLPARWRARAGDPSDERDRTTAPAAEHVGASARRVLGQMTRGRKAAS